MNILFLKDFFLVGLKWNHYVQFGLQYYLTSEDFRLLQLLPSWSLEYQGQQKFIFTSHYQTTEARILGLKVAYDRRLLSVNDQGQGHIIINMCTKCNILAMIATIPSYPAWTTKESCLQRIFTFFFDFFFNYSHGMSESTLKNAASVIIE